VCMLSLPTMIYVGQKYKFKIKIIPLEKYRQMYPRVATPCKHTTNVLVIVINN
jgi:hypothetical protein